MIGNDVKRTNFRRLAGFYIRQQITVKEVAVLRDGTTLSHYIFREPEPWHFLTRSEKSQASWLKINHRFPMG